MMGTRSVLGSRVFVSTMVAAMLVVAMAGPVSATDDSQAPTQTVEQLASGREALGFDPGITELLMQSTTALQNLEETGFLLSADEALLYAGRQDLAARLEAAIANAPLLRSFAGMRLEHSAHGVFHFYFADAKESEAFAASIPVEFEPRVAIHVVAFTQELLVDEMERLWSVVGPDEAQEIVISVSVDVATNGLVAVLNSDPSLSIRASSTAAALADAARVPIAIAFGSPERDANCASRSDCDSPMRAGIRVNKGSRYNSYGCTMGFNARTGTGNEVFMTSGHCGTSGSNSWYHPGYGYLGSEILNKHSSGYDVMSVDMPDSQASGKIYWNTSTTRNVSGYYGNHQLYTGMSICMSGRVSGNLCGTITSVYTSWGGSPTMYGGDASFIPYFGDSGGPVYRHVSSSTNMAVGVVATTGGKFVRIADSLSKLGLTIMTS